MPSSYLQLLLQHATLLYSQDHQAGEVGKGVVWDVIDSIEGKGHCLQGREAGQRPDGHMGQHVIIQPQVAQGSQPLEAARWHHTDVVGIQTSGTKGDTRLPYQLH